MVAEIPSGNDEGPSDVYEYDGEERLFTGHTGRLFLLLTAIWLFISLTSRMLPPLLPAIIDDLAITAFLGGVALTVERVMRAGAEFPSGRYADGLTRTTVLVGCIGCVILGLTLLSVSFSYVLFILGVAVFGLGRGLYTPAAIALLSDLFAEKRGIAIGFNKTGSELAGIAGAGIAVVIVSVATWRAAFLPLAALLVPLLAAFFLSSREPIRLAKVDLTVRETGRRVVAIPAVRWILVVYSLYVIASSGVSTFLPIFLIEVHGVSFAIASSAFALLYAVGIVSKPTSGFLSDRFPRLYVAGGGLFVGAVGLAILVMAPTETVAIAAVLLYAFGYRGLSPALQAYLMDSFPDSSMGGDFGAVRTVYLIVGSLGPAYAGFTASTIGFVPAFASFLLFYLVGAALLVWYELRRA